MSTTTTTEAKCVTIKLTITLTRRQIGDDADRELVGVVSTQICSKFLDIDRERTIQSLVREVNTSEWVDTFSILSDAWLSSVHSEEQPMDDVEATVPIGMLGLTDGDTINYYIDGVTN
jgi:hypothetical protein